MSRKCVLANTRLEIPYSDSTVHRTGACLITISIQYNTIHYKENVGFRTYIFAAVSAMTYLSVHVQ
jgi:hypothetical protein